MEFQEMFEDAIAHGNIQVYYQPVVRTLSYKLCSFEALARWVDDDGNVIPPSEFVPKLEQHRLIHKLDLEIVRLVCQKLNEQMRLGNTIVPISFNLSRLDFELCDIFEEIEKIVRDYEIPRNYLHIEITETTVMQKSQAIHVAIDEIHTAGYQIWMDDFGSGYSSLNVLKDFDFDELKIDMQFLSTFNEKSKNIITAIVEMAKKIGMHTLAEGVETKEQLDFLRGVGCEKVQGYYYGKPLPYEESVAHCRNFSIYMEDRREAAYYDQVGHMSLVTDRATGIMRRVGEHMIWISANESMERLIAAIGLESMHAFNDALEDHDSVVHVAFLNAIKEIDAKKRELEFTYTDGDYYVKIIGRQLAKADDETMYSMALDAIPIQENDENAAFLNDAIRDVISSFETVNLVNVKENLHQKIMRRNVFLDEEHKEKTNFSYERKRFAKESVYFEDQKAFLDFTDPAYFVQEIQEQREHMIGDIFRVKDEITGLFEEKFFQIRPSSKEKNEYLIIRSAHLDREQSMEARLLDAQYFSSDDPRITYRDLWEGFMNDHNNLMWFIKDRERRFLAVSESFMEYYGILDASYILGKTDEQMQWHIDDEPMRKDEIRVIEYGERVLQEHGMCIAKGRNHNILVTKLPLYHNGEIVGLIGAFSEEESVAGDGIDASSRVFVDSVTGVLNFSGLWATAASFEQTFRDFEKPYAVICLSLEGYQQTLKSYGRKITNHFLRRIATELLEALANRAVIGRYVDGVFLILYQYEQKVDVRQLILQMFERLRAVTDVDGYPVYVNAKDSIVWSGEVKNLDEIPELVRKRLRQSEQNASENQPSAVDRISIALEKFDDFAEVCFIIDPETYEIVYANSETKKRFAIDGSGKHCYEVLRNSSVPCEGCHSMERLKGSIQKSRFRNSMTGDNYFLLETSTLWGEKEMRLGVAVDINQFLAEHLHEPKDAFVKQLETDMMRLVMGQMGEIDDNRLIPVMIEKIGRSMKADGVYLYESNRSATEFTCEISWKNPDADIPYHGIGKIDDYHMNRIFVQKDETQIIVPDLSQLAKKEPTMTRVCNFYLERGVRGIIGEKLIYRNKVMGYLEIVNPDYDLLDDGKMVLAIASQFVTAFVREKNYRIALEEKSTVDGLTGVQNRAGYRKRAKELEASNETNLAFIYGDLNGLKKLNDQTGHSSGDAYIKKAADILSDFFLRENVFRMGGDEFLVITKVPQQDQLDEILADLRTELQKENVSMAIGCYWVSEVGSDIEKIIREVDARMYINKEVMHAEKEFLDGNPSNSDFSM